MPSLGLKKNFGQFTLLVIINAFVGGMIGMERSILPEIAEQEFHIFDKSIILSFIIVFGVSKAIANYFTGVLANRFGRKKLLIIGWLLSAPVPFIFMYANNWNWIVFANFLMGIHQGFAWSSTVVMKMDLVAEKERGLAMGLNEFAGYLAVACVAYFTAWVAAKFGLRPYPFYIGIGLILLGLAGTIFFIKETLFHSHAEAKESVVPKMKNIFLETTFVNKNLSSVTQAGLVNNLNDGMIWGLLPMLLALKKFSLQDIGIITAVYPAVWGIAQLFTGKLSDIFGRKPLLFTGMFLQGIIIVMINYAENYFQFFILSFFLGIGTALVYPTFLASIADNTHPSQRAESVGVFRLWRDGGYAIGALLTGILAEIFNIELGDLAAIPRNKLIMPLPNIQIQKKLLEKIENYLAKNTNLDRGDLRLTKAA